MAESSLDRHISYGIGGMDMDNIPSQIKPGKVTYALNATIESSQDGSSVSYQNEVGNTLAVSLPDSLQVIGAKPIIELNRCILLSFSSTGDHEIGYFELGKNEYNTLTKGGCLNFDLEHPINKIEYEINGDAVRIYWADDYNPNRYLDINRLAFTQEKGDIDCDVIISTELDCNRLKVQPDYSIPFITDIQAISGGSLTEGSYQFGIQYSDSVGTQYSEVYNMSNPIPVFKGYVSQDFNLPTSKAISLAINNLDTAVYQYFNLIVAKTINNITSFEVAGTYPISSYQKVVIYTGENKTGIKLTSDDIFQKFPRYERSKGVTQSDKVLIWNGITEDKRVNYQGIASSIKLQYVKYKIPYTLLYDNSSLSEEYRGYMGDEVYAFEFQPILRSGKKCDGFHIPGREATAYDKEIINNPLLNNKLCNTEDTSTERWRVENTSQVIEVIGTDPTPESNPLQTQLKQQIDNLNNKISGINDLITSTQKEIGTYNTNIIDLSNASKSSAGQILLSLLGPVGIVAGLFDQGFHSLSYELGTANTNSLYEAVSSNPVDIDLVKSLLNPYLNKRGEGKLAETIINLAESINEDYLTLSSLAISLADATNELNSLYEEFNRIIGTTPLCNPTVWEYGNFGYYESTETYPCNKDIWGELSGKPIRHHRFPQRKIHDSEGNIYPLGVKIDIDSLKEAIKNSSLTQEQKDDIIGFKILRGDRINHKSVIAKGIINNIGTYTQNGETRFYPNYPFNDVRPDPFLSISQTGDDSGSNIPLRLNGFYSQENKKRFTFHSPDTSFFQPSMGDHIKLETIEYGQSSGHFIPVKDHPKYQIPSRAAYATAIAITMGMIAAGSKEGIGPGGLDFAGGAKTDWQQGIQVLLSTLDIINKSIPHKDLAYQFNSIGDYTLSKGIPLQQQSIFPLNDNSRYISDGLANVADIYSLNNFLRESSIYLSLNSTLPFTHELYPEIQDTSRWLCSDNNCKQTDKTSNISSYYVALKQNLTSQYGQLYSYNTIDTGYYYDLLNDTSTSEDIFGGDIYISKFSYKSKHSFFTKNLVGRQDNLGLDFRNYPNVGYPAYWLSNERDGKFTWGDAYQEAASILEGAAAGGLGSMSIGGAVRGAVAGAILGGIGVLLDNWQNNFDCAGKKFFYQDGKFYLFAYGISTFYVESEINCNYRQAYNGKEGDFYPHAGDTDEWLQEINVPIVNDNTYWYNKSFSKQNMEDYFSHLPADYDPNQNVTHTNRAIYSEKQASEVNYKINRWLLYRPVSYYDFPQTNGKLISLDNIENGAVLARFENKSELYNAMLRIDTSNPQAVYLGNSTLFSSAPPIDYSNTDTGYMGSQHTFLLKTEYGNISVDSERGDVFLIAGQRAKDISGEVSKFLTKNLSFKIREQFPGINIDNAFNGIGLSGVYDAIGKRAIITKLDYKPLHLGITEEGGKFYYNNGEVSLTDPNHFENHCFTISFDLERQVPISFHSYFPNYYVQAPNYFYSNLSTGVWQHNPNNIQFNNFYGEIEPYIIEYPFSYKLTDEILQSIQDYTKVIQYSDPDDITNSIEADNIYFDNSILYSPQQCSGVLLLTQKPVGNMAAYKKYPVYNLDSKEILYSRKNHFFQYNTFWSLIRDKTKPLFKKASNLSLIKEINQDNMDYSKRSFKKETLTGKELKIRHTLSSTSSYKLISQFILSQTQKSFS